MRKTTVLGILLTLVIFTIYHRYTVKPVSKKIVSKICICTLCFQLYKYTNIYAESNIK